MKDQISSRVRKIAYLLTLVYFGSYLMRINFTVMMVKICSDMSLTKTSLAVVITGLTVSYGFGQLVSGFIGDRISPVLMVSSGLGIAAICNVLMCFGTVVPYMTVVWTVNGFAHAMLWQPIVRLMSTYLDEHEYSYAMVRVSWGLPLQRFFVSWVSFAFKLS